uniref:Putative ovule protein n=1 Tax=Solanum chacoense TaxID=4108 RepID=A0A0V0HVU3_SOLCH
MTCGSRLDNNLSYILYIRLSLLYHHLLLILCYHFKARLSTTTRGTPFGFTSAINEYLEICGLKQTLFNFVVINHVIKD